MFKMDYKSLIDVVDAANLLRVKPKRIYNLVWLGRLSPALPGQTKWFTVKEIERYRESRYKRK